MATADEHFDLQYQNQMLLWEAFVKENPFYSQDFWLESMTAWGWERVAIVMGYGDDYNACYDIKETLEAKYSGADYRCMPANYEVKLGN